MTRERLVRLLDGVPVTDLTQLVAPAGTGKTELLTAWSTGRELVWLTVDRWHRLLAEILGHYKLMPTGDEDEALAALRRRPPSAARPIVVLDDAHLLEPKMRRLIARVTIEAPGSASFVLAGRAESEFPQTPVSLTRSATTVEARQLLLTESEAATLVRLLAPGIEPTELSRTVRDGRGWAASLVLASLPPQTSAGLIRRAEEQLVDAALSTLGEDEVLVLVATCDEDMIDSASARALVGQADPIGVLVGLARDGVLVREGSEVTPTGPDPRWQQHPLLRRVLRRRSRSAPRLRTVRTEAHARAAGLLSDAEQAVGHAVLAEDEELLRSTLRARGHELLSPRKLLLLEAALERVPARTRSLDPGILVLDALVDRLRLRFEDASRRSVAASELISNSSTSGPEHEIVLDEIAQMDVWRARSGWADQELAIARARDRLGCQHEGVEPIHDLRPGQSLLAASWLMGDLAAFEIQLGRLEDAAVHLRQLTYNGGMLENDRMVAMGLVHQSFLELLDGAFVTAAETARKSLAVLNHDPPNLPLFARLHLVLGWTALHQLDVAAAQDHLDVARRADTIRLDPVLGVIAQLLDSRLLADRGDVSGARRCVAELGNTKDLPPFLRRLVALVEAQEAALASDVAILRDQVDVLRELGFHDDADLFDAIARAGEGDVAGALADLSDLGARPRVAPSAAAGSTATQVGLLLRVGDRASAAELLPGLLNRVAPQRMIQILSSGFLGGHSFVELLEDESRRPDGHPFAAEALLNLERYSQERPDDGSPTIRSADQALRPSAAPRERDAAAPPLTPRERAVLLEFSHGGSYADVAHALFVTENTVKTHLTSVYRKLGVRRRGEALREARRHQLIP